MFSALKPKPLKLSSKLSLLQGWRNKEPASNKPWHITSTPDQLTICESTSKFLLTMFLATTHSSTTPITFFYFSSIN